MPGTDVMGGWEWARLELEAAIAEAEQAFRWAQQQGYDIQAARQYASDYMQNTLQQYAMMGYIPSTPLQMNWAPAMSAAPVMPTEREAALAVWENRPDIREWYTANWGANPDPQAAINDWLATTPEQIGDLVSYAQGQGWLAMSKPSYDWSWPELDIGELVPTLERQNLENQWGLAERQLGLTEQEIESNAALQYLGLLSQQQGPGDWVNYWGTIRGAQNTELPAWVDALVSGQDLQPWGREYGSAQRALPVGEPIYFSPPGQGGEMHIQPYPYTPGQGQATSPTWAQMAQKFGLNRAESTARAVGGINPWQVSARQWSRMLPSEREGLLGGVSQLGGWGEDFAEQMRRAFPTGQYTATSYWR